MLAGIMSLFELTRFLKKKTPAREQDRWRSADQVFASLSENDWVHLDSSYLHSVAFYTEVGQQDGTLRVRFLDGSGTAVGNICEYYHVPGTVYNNLVTAGPRGTPHSKGVYFYHFIRESYPFTYIKYVAA